MPPTAQRSQLRPGDTAPADATVLTLAQLERILVGGQSRQPSDLTLVHETTRALQALDRNSAAYATIVCEASDSGLRVTQGRDAIEVARSLRARAQRRGDHIWAQRLGDGLRFRIVRQARPPVPVRQKRLRARITRRALGTAARLATS